MKKDRERRCVATGEVGEEADLIRIALGPDNAIVPDLAARLPGRGAWVGAQRALIDQAVKKKAFNRAFGGPVDVPDDFSGQIEALLAQRALNLIGLARRAGELAAGQDAVRLAMKATRPAWRIEASDAAPDGRSKLDRLAKAAWGDTVPVAGCFLAEEIGQALGRGPTVHASMSEGSQARAFSVVMRKLSGFRVLDPAGMDGRQDAE
ncbi:RNA-binding protein [Maricaulis parjimensis]|uniref:RNA-binding protein n=1 Tax=Maricaulis parjimensis TaxID=144023 RepID=UPI0019398D0F|nr:RNA-binding protein [Maricaulis parjimensis]